MTQHTPGPWKPPYPYEMHGRCVRCRRNDVPLFRVWGPNMFRYRCERCIKHEPSLPPRALLAKIEGKDGS